MLIIDRRNCINLATTPSLAVEDGHTVNALDVSQTAREDLLSIQLVNFQIASICAHSK